MRGSSVDIVRHAVSTDPTREIVDLFRQLNLSQDEDSNSMWVALHNNLAQALRKNKLIVLLKLTSVAQRFDVRSR
jgi:hypothetical protein